MAGIGMQNSYCAVGRPIESILRIWQRAIPKVMSWTPLILILVVVIAVAPAKELRTLVLLAAVALIAVLVLKLLAAHGPA